MTDLTSWLIRLAPWVLGCGVAAWLFRSRPVAGVISVIVLWIAVPAIAGHHLTGLSSGALAFHPATWLLFAVLGVQLLTNPAPLGRALGQHVYVFLVVGVFVVGAFATSRLQGAGGTRLLIDQIIGPMALFWLLIAFARSRHQLHLVRNALLAVVAAQCLLAVVQSRVGSILFYQADYEKLPWFKPPRFDRWMGTTDSPLALSLAICVTAPLTLSLKNSRLRVLLLILYFVGVLITQSRTGTALMGLIIIYATFRARAALWARVLTCVVLVGAALTIAAAGLVDGLAGRLANDTGSVDARVRAVDFFYGHWTEFLVVGRGLTASYAVANDAGLQTSFESSYLMYVVDTGAILATLYFGTQFCLIVRHGLQRSVPGATLGAFLGCGLQHTFSAVAGTNLSGTLIWTLIAIVVAASELPHLIDPLVRSNTDDVGSLQRLDDTLSEEPLGHPRRALVEER